jgi:hypothetical protein
MTDWTGQVRLIFQIKIVRRETGKEQAVRVRRDEGLAIRIGPKPCAVTREGVGAASAGAV